MSGGDGVKGGIRRASAVYDSLAHEGGCCSCHCWGAPVAILPILT